MKKLTFSLGLIFLLTAGNLQAQNNSLETYFKLSDYFFKRYVYNGLVNYQYASKNAKEIDLLFDMIATIDLSGESDDVKKAFYINAYNLLVIHQVVRSYPIDNPLDEDGFFDKNTFEVAGESMTLNQLELNKMLGDYKDPRFHFVLACAASSCPKLANFGYTPGGVEDLLEERTRLVLNDDDFIKVNDSRKRVQVSKIFEWYKKDFDATGLSLIDFINQYRNEKIPSNYKVEFYEYNWSLNERKS